MCCSSVKEIMFQQPNHSPYYRTVSPLSCDPLGVIMVWRLISLVGCFLSPLNSPYLLNYHWNGRLLTLTIYSNIFWSLMITYDKFIDKSPPPLDSFIFIFIWIIMIIFYCWWLIPISSAASYGINFTVNIIYFKMVMEINLIL